MGKGGMASLPAQEKLVFVCHAFANATTALAIVSDLEAANIPCWIGPRDVPGGADYATEIVSAIRGAKILMLLMSREAVESPHCLRELELATRNEISILPIRLDRVEATGGLEYRLATAQWLDFNAPGFHENLFTSLKPLLSFKPERPTLQAEQIPTSGKDKQRPTPPVQPIAGRESEMRRLEAAIHDVAKSQTGKLILLRGTSGIGKSTLMANAAKRAEEMGFWIVGSVCEPFHEGMSFFPVRELMRQLCAEQNVQNAIVRLYGENSNEAAMAAIAELTTADPVARRDALLGTFANIVFGRAHVGGGVPLLLTLDDLERVDVGTVDSLLCLVARLADGPVLVLGSYRTDVVDAAGGDHPIAPLVSAVGRSGRRAETIGLDALPENKLDEIIRAILGDETELPIQFKQKLWKQTEGNPLFLREILHALQRVEAGRGPRLSLTDGRWRLTGDVANWETPKTVEEAVRTRLEMMAIELRGELERAAVIGKRFAFEIMRRISETKESELLERLERCIELSLILESPDAPDSFEFSHGLIREVLYRSMSRIRRRRLHSVVADSLQALRGVISEDWEALVGEHLYQADRHSEAWPVLYQAAKHLLSVSAAIEASNVLEKALDSAIRGAANAVVLTEMKVARIEALVIASEYERARQHAQALADDTLVSEVARGWAWDHLGDIEWASGRGDAAFAAYAKAENVAVSECNAELALEVSADLAEAHERTAERLSGVDNEGAEIHRQMAERYLSRQIELSGTSSDIAARSRAMRNEAKRFRRAGDIQGAIKKYEAGLALMDPRIASHSILISYAKTLRYAGRHDDAKRIVERVLNWSMQSGARRSLGIAYYYRAILTFESSGATDSVIDDLKLALAIHREIGYGRGIWEVQTLIGEWQVARGQRSDAISTFREALDLSHDTQDDAIVTSISDQLIAIDERQRAQELRDRWNSTRA